MPISMDTPTILIVVFCFLVVSFLYSAVGHGGASGYLAIMALLSFPIISIKPTSLILNIIVSAIGSYKYLKAGCFDKKVFIIFSITSIPLAFIGGYIKVDPHLFKIFSGVFLICTSVFLLLRMYINHNVQKNEINLPLAFGIGALIGLVSGLLGVGGGIFLSPIIITLGYTSIRNASGVSALFILCNSIFGLIGNYQSFNHVDFNIIFWIFTVIVGGYFGSHFGAKRFNNKVILVFLSIVLFSAGLKFIFVR